MAGINAAPSINNMGNAFIPPYPAGGATWPAPGGFGGSAQNPTAYAAGQVQEQHTQTLSNIMVTLSGLQQNVNMLGMNNMMQGTISSSTKSMKMLSGASKYQVIAWTGLTLQDEVPELMRILDSNESMTIKMQALENRLRAVQRENILVNFTIRKETVKDLQNHLFTFEPHESHMMRGFTPFCLQKLEQGSEIALRQYEEQVEHMTFTSFTEIAKKDSILKFTRIGDPYSFLTAIFNTYALAWSVFTVDSPLTQGLQDLIEILAKGLHNGELASAGAFQTDWYSHVLWGLYECIDKFFQMRLSEADLRRGARLTNPLSAFNVKVGRFAVYLHPRCPASLLANPQSPSESQVEDSGKYGKNAQGVAKTKTEMTKSHRKENSERIVSSTMR